MCCGACVIIQMRVKFGIDRFLIQELMKGILAVGLYDLEFHNLAGTEDKFEFFLTKMHYGK